MNKGLEEDIKILKNITKQDFSNPMGWSGYYDSELKKLQQAIKNMLADRERLKNKADKCNNLENEIAELRERPVFYYDNNRNTYVWCCRCTDSNMSLHMFLENGEIQGYASEHYDRWVENAKEVKQVDVCEFMHKFVKPFIVKANKYDSLAEKIKEKIESVINEGKADSEKYMEDVMFRQGYYKALEELLDAGKQ